MGSLVGREVVDLLFGGNFIGEEELEEIFGKGFVVVGGFGEDLLVFGDGFVVEMDVFFGVEDRIFLDEVFDVMGIVIDLVESDFVNDFGVMFFVGLMIVC